MKPMIVSEALKFESDVFTSFIGKGGNGLGQTVSKAQSFASDNDIATELASKRPMKTPRRPGEQATDDRPTDAILLFKAEVYYYCLDTVICQLKDRFTDDTLSIFEEMSHFTHSKLLTEEVVIEEVAELCATYGLDAICVVRELNEFRHAYRSAHYMINMDDLLLLEKQRGKRQPQARNTENINILQQDAEAESNTDEDDDELAAEPEPDNDSEVEESESENHLSQSQGKSLSRCTSLLYCSVFLSILIIFASFPEK